MNRGCILLVKDEPILALGLKVQFERWGFEPVDLANTYQDALLHLENHSVTLAVVVLQGDDHCLQTILPLQGQYPHPIVFLSNFTIQSDRKRLKSFPVYRRINKPCHIPELRKAVESLLAIHLPKD